MLFTMSVTDHESPTKVPGYADIINECKSIAQSSPKIPLPLLRAASLQACVSFSRVHSELTEYSPPHMEFCIVDRTLPASSSIERESLTADSNLAHSAMRTTQIKETTRKLTRGAFPCPSRTTC